MYQENFSRMSTRRSVITTLLLLVAAFALSSEALTFKDPKIEQDDILGLLSVQHRLKRRFLTTDPIVFQLEEISSMNAKALENSMLKEITTEATIQIETVTNADYNDDGVIESGGTLPSSKVIKKSSLKRFRSFKRFKRHLRLLGEKLRKSGARVAKAIGIDSKWIKNEIKLISCTALSREYDALEMKVTKAVKQASSILVNLASEFAKNSLGAEEKMLASAVAVSTTLYHTLRRTSEHKRSEKIIDAGNRGAVNFILTKIVDGSKCDPPRAHMAKMSDSAAMPRTANGRTSVDPDTFWSEQQ